MFKLTHDAWTRNVRAAVSYGTTYGAYFHGGHIYFMSFEHGELDGEYSLIGCMITCLFLCMLLGCLAHAQ